MLLLGLVLRFEGSRIVARRLGEAHAAAHRTDIVLFHINADRVQPFRIIRANRRTDYDKQQVLCRMDADMRIHADDERADVKRCAVLMRNPILIHRNKLFDRVLSEFLVDQRDAETIVGNVQTCHILVGTEQQDPVVRRAVCFHALEYRLPIMQAHRSRIEFQRRIRDNSRIMPALSFVIIHNEHMICEDLAKAQLAFILRLCLWMLR